VENKHNAVRELDGVSGLAINSKRNLYWAVKDEEDYYLHIVLVTYLDTHRLR